MNDPAKSVETLFEKAGDYTRTTIELMKLNAVDRSAEVISMLTARMVIGLVAALSVVVLSIGIALWTGELLGKSYYGFFAVAGCYVVAAVLLYAFRRTRIKDPVSNSIIIQMLKKG